MINQIEKSKKKVTFGNVKISYFEPEEYFDAWQEATIELEEVVPSPPFSPPSSPRPTSNPAPKRPLVSDDEDEAPLPTPKKQRVDENSVCGLVARASVPSPVVRRVLVESYKVPDDDEEEQFSPVLGATCDFEVYRDEESSFSVFGDLLGFPSPSPPSSPVLSPLPSFSLPSDSSTEDE